MSQIRNIQAAIKPQNQMAYPLPMTKSKHRKHRQHDWDENFTQSNIPDYRVYQDKFAQGYISILKKNKKFKQYLNVIMKPGGIRVLKKASVDVNRAESTYSEGSPTKNRSNVAAGGSQAPVNRNAQAKGSIASSAHKKLRGAISQNRKEQVQDYEVNDEQVVTLKQELQNAWSLNLVPPHHMAKFTESIQQLDPRVMCSIIAKELEDLSANNAPIQRVLKAIMAREECLKQIEEFSQNQLKNPNHQSQTDSSTSVGAAAIQPLVDQIAKYLINLRYLSVHVVESIVLWRDQLRYIAILSSGNRQKFRKQQVPPALQVPFIGADNINYMIKMKNDTSHFSTLEIAKYFNFCDISRSDPFLITASLQQRNHAAGSGIRAIKNGKNNQTEKLILPLQEQLINKAKACEEVILFERGDLRCNPSSFSIRQNLASPSNGSISQTKSQAHSAEKENDHKQSSAPQADNRSNQSPSFKVQNNDKTETQGQTQLSNQKVQQNVNTVTRAVVEGTAVTNNTQQVTPQPATQGQINQETPNPDDVTFTIEPVNLKESEFEQYFETYLKSVDERIVNSYHTMEQIIEKQNAGYDRHYVKLAHNGTTRGLAIFNIDPSAANEQRCYIRHISTTVFGDLQKAISQVVDFIWKKVQCSNIRVEIFHLKEEATGKFQADVDVKNAYTQATFKWKTLTNDPATGKRAQIMQANKPATAAQFENVRHLDLGKEPVTIAAGLIMGVGKDKQKPKDQNSKSSCEIVTCLLGSFKHIKESKNIETSYADQNKQASASLKKYLGVVDKIPADTKFAALRAASCSGQDEALANFSTQGLQVQLNKQYNDYITSVLSLVARLPSFDFAQQNGFYYLRIKSQSIMRVKHIDQASRKQVGSDIAIIPTDDERLKIVIIPIDVANSKSLDKEGVAAEVQRILKNCEVSEKQVSDVWLPSFSISHKAESTSLKGLSISDGNTVQEAQEVATIQLCKGDYQKEGLAFEVSADSSLVIKQSFIFALSDAELEENIENLPLIAVRVDQKDWIKKL